MTAQIDDMFLYKDSTFCIAGISEGELFDPYALDLEPVGTCSACWRGYQAFFALSGDNLILQALHVNLLAEGEGYVRKQGPKINGVTPCAPKQGAGDWFNNHYQNLNFHLRYSGGLLLAQEFIQDLYEHMGFHPAWKYRRVLELIFSNGVLQQALDRSERMQEIRQLMRDSSSENDYSLSLNRDKILEFVRKSFDRSYDY